MLCASNLRWCCAFWESPHMSICDVPEVTVWLVVWSLVCGVCGVSRCSATLFGVFRSCLETPVFDVVTIVYSCWYILYVPLLPCLFLATSFLSVLVFNAQIPWWGFVCCIFHVWFPSWSELFSGTSGFKYEYTVSVISWFERDVSVCISAIGYLFNHLGSLGVLEANVCLNLYVLK